MNENFNLDYVADLNNFIIFTLIASVQDEMVSFL